jgi:hypothetical protein
MKNRPPLAGTLIRIAAAVFPLMIKSLQKTY